MFRQSTIFSIQLSMSSWKTWVETNNDQNMKKLRHINIWHEPLSLLIRSCTVVLKCVIDSFDLETKTINIYNIIRFLLHFVAIPNCKCTTDNLQSLYSSDLRNLASNQLQFECTSCTKKLNIRILISFLFLNYISVCIG